MTPTAVVRPLPGAGLVTRSGELLLVCADGAAGVEELLGLVAEVASSGGDGSVLVRRVAALLAADFAGRYPACAVSGPAGDVRLAVLVHGSAWPPWSAARARSCCRPPTRSRRSTGWCPTDLRGTARASRRRVGEPAVPAGGRGHHGGRCRRRRRSGRTGAELDPPQAAAPAVESVAAAAPAAESVAWSASSIMDSQVAPEWPPRPVEVPSAEEPPVPFPFTMDPPADPPPYPLTDSPVATVPYEEPEPPQPEPAAPAMEAPEAPRPRRSAYAETFSRRTGAAVPAARLRR
jgi:hypothetical protein